MGEEMLALSKSINPYASLVIIYLVKEVSHFFLDRWFGRTEKVKENSLNEFLGNKVKSVFKPKQEEENGKESGTQT